MTYQATARMKGVQCRKVKAMNIINNTIGERRDYESVGRAFESLRVRHFPPVSTIFKNRIVPLFRVCTPFHKN